MSNGYDIAILVLKKHFVLNNNVQLAKLPPLGVYCPTEGALIASGWGAEIIRKTGGFEIIGKKNHRYLWAVKQNCVDIGQCTRHTGNKDAIICTKGPTDARDGACYGVLYHSCSCGRRLVVRLGMFGFQSPIFHRTQRQNP